MSASNAKETSIADVLADDHKEIGILLDRLAGQLKDGDGGAAGTLSALDKGLRRHMKWEEEVLFPAVLTGVPGDRRRHIESLAIDHESIRESLGTLQGLVEGGWIADARASLDRLRILLIGHNDDEELGAYRDADRHLTEPVRRGIAASFLGYRP